jgi:hypothetical protein
MSKQAFLQNLRTARNVFFDRVGPQSAHEDLRDPRSQLARAIIWLAPATVSGFNPSQFGELPPDVREQLKDRVQQFLDVARHVRADKPTQDEIQRAMPVFLDIVKILDPYLSADEEARRIREVLEGVEFPPGIVTWDFAVGADSTGDPAVRIWLFLDEDVVRRKEVSRVMTAARQRIHDALAAAGIQRWPYVHARTPEEQRALGSVSQ